MVLVVVQLVLVSRVIPVLLRIVPRCVLGIRVVQRIKFVWVGNVQILVAQSPNSFVEWMQNVLWTKRRGVQVVSVSMVTREIPKFGVPSSLQLYSNHFVIWDVDMGRNVNSWIDDPLVNASTLLTQNVKKGKEAKTRTRTRSVFKTEKIQTQEKNSNLEGLELKLVLGMRNVWTVFKDVSTGNVLILVNFWKLFVGKIRVSFN